MMLFKKIIAQYGRSISGQTVPSDFDEVYELSNRDQCRQFRQDAIDDISGSKIYLLDGEAAHYADSFHHDLDRGNEGEVASAEAINFLREVNIPYDLIWVEFDYDLIVADRRRVGLAAAWDFEPPRNIKMGSWGFLYDNRNPTYFRVVMFSGASHAASIDPLGEMRFAKGSDGKAGLSRADLYPHRHMLSYHAAIGTPESDFLKDARAITTVAAYEMAIGLILLALIDSPDNGIFEEERESLTSSERKTARKFGKAWMTEALRSHVTIRIGHDARAHLQEKAARREHEIAQSTSRNSPVEHWVSEHERRYKSGKIVRIASYRRGVEVDRSIPTRVMGPRSER